LALTNRAKFSFASDLFGGIIACLMAQCGGNVDECGAVSIGPCGAECCWFEAHLNFPSRDSPGQSIAHDFQKLSLVPTHYSIWSYSSGKSSSHPQSRVFKGSNLIVLRTSMTWMVIMPRRYSKFHAR
jgi:hypothetical protein